LRDKTSLKASGVEKTKYFIQQGELMHQLSDMGELLHELTSEDFDAFPVLKVEPFRTEYVIDRKWILSNTSKIILGVGIVFFVFLLLVVVFIHDIKSKKNLR